MKHGTMMHVECWWRCWCSCEEQNSNWME